NLGSRRSGRNSESSDGRTVATSTLTFAGQRSMSKQQNVMRRNSSHFNRTSFLHAVLPRLRRWRNRHAPFPSFLQWLVILLAAASLKVCHNRAATLLPSPIIRVR